MSEAERAAMFDVTNVQVIDAQTRQIAVAERISENGRLVTCSVYPVHSELVDGEWTIPATEYNRFVGTLRSHPSLWAQMLSVVRSACESA